MTRPVAVALAFLGCSPELSRSVPAPGLGAGGDASVDAPNLGLQGTGGGLDGFTAADDAKSCGLQKFMLQHGPAEILLVLDSSDSMRTVDMGPDGKAVERMQAMREAVDGVIGQTEDHVYWGFKFYPLGNGCFVNSGVDVAIAPHNHEPIMRFVRNLPPNGGTPTQAAIRAATAHLKMRTTANPKFLVLATDGLPGCGDGRVVEGDAAGSWAAVSDAAGAGFPTYVVGVSTAGTDADEILNQLAVRGQRARAFATKYYAVTGRDELVGALNGITAEVTSCVFTLTQMPPSPDDVALDVDGVRVPRDDTRRDGWAYGAGMKSVEVFGAACERLKAGMVENVAFTFGCPHELIP